MQPHMFMWCGLLKSILDSDIHVILDITTASKNDRYNRNLVAGNAPSRWLTLPFIDFHRSCLIKDLQVDTSSNCLDDLKNIFVGRYHKAPFLESCTNIICATSRNEQSNKLIDIYCQFLDELKKYGLSIPEVLCASTILSESEIENLRSPIKMVNAILAKINAETYLAAHNISKYSKPSDYSVKNVAIQTFEYQPYTQNSLNDEFIPNLSCLDAIAYLELSSFKNFLDSSNFWSIHD